ncbi:MAG: oxygen-independent coproporphyrinogen III oxidase [Xanthobacteraceae bacterium]|nr:oxygen-independent coproporphyrinogen III oxidase [Xanthobacteraceae bacterium]
MVITPAFAEQAVPRYTSYPTAPHFSSVVGAQTYASWLSSLPPEAMLSLYIHVPYCSELCFYCGCHTKAVQRRKPIEVYADRLLDEIALVGASIAPRRVVHLHWGGGTPSILGVERLLEITTKLKEVFDFTAVHEHAIELDPRHVDRPLAGALAAMGVNRASLGVQDFTPHVQEAIGRIQPFGMVEQTIAMLREVGINQVNFDLMYGLPKQTTRDVRRTAELAASLQPQRLAWFGYAHVPWFKIHQRMIDEATLPSPFERLEQAETARETLHKFGYRPIGLDHFALSDDDLAAAQRCGLLRRNFQGYTTSTADALLGFGTSAIGRLPQGFVQNASDVMSYSQAVAAGRFATVKGVALSSEDRLRGHIIERLMCDLCIDLDTIANNVADGAKIEFDAELTALASFEDEGMVRLDCRRIQVTEKGRPFMRLVAAVFDDYLQQGRARHSVAI